MFVCGLDISHLAKIKFILGEKISKKIKFISGAFLSLAIIPFIVTLCDNTKNSNDKNIDRSSPSLTPPANFMPGDKKDGDKNVTNISEAFSYVAEFNQDISIWDISNVRNMSGVFDWATKFNIR